MRRAAATDFGGAATHRIHFLAHRSLSSRGLACQRAPFYRRGRGGFSTNLGSEGLASADRNNKATLLLTAPCPTVKSSARDLFPRMVKLQYTDRGNQQFS